MNSLLIQLLPIILLLSALAVFYTYVFLRTPHTFRIKFIGIPVLLVSAMFALLSLDNMLGRPYPSTPAHEFTFIQYRVVLDSDNKKWIEMWGIEKSTSRLYVFPYTKQAEQQLKGAREKKEEGIEQKGKFRKTDRGSRAVPSDVSELEMYDIPTNLLPPKVVEPRRTTPMNVSPMVAPQNIPDF